MREEPRAPEEHQPFDPDVEAAAGIDDVDPEAEVDEPRATDEVIEEERPHSDDEADLP